MSEESAAPERDALRLRRPSEDAAGPPLRTTSQQLAQSSGSYEMVLSAVLLGLVGLWIDRRVGTTPLFVIALTVLGFAGATASVYYRYRHRIEQLQTEAAAMRAAAGVRPSSPPRDR